NPAARAASADRQRSALHHHGTEDYDRPRTNRRQRGQHLRAHARTERSSAAQALHRLAADGGDGEVDLLNYQVYRELLSYMAEDPHTIGSATRLLFISKYLERIADHATNIAEMVTFMVKGKMIRHDETKKRAT